jgi:hypothetical protein
MIDERLQERTIEYSHHLYSARRLVIRCLKVEWYSAETVEDLIRLSRYLPCEETSIINATPLSEMEKHDLKLMI